jgi:hypothetical protein
MSGIVEVFTSGADMLCRKGLLLAKGFLVWVPLVVKVAKHKLCHSPAFICKERKAYRMKLRSTTIMQDAQVRLVEKVDMLHLILKFLCMDRCMKPKADAKPEGGGAEMCEEGLVAPRSSIEYMRRGEIISIT